MAYIYWQKQQNLQAENEKLKKALLCYATHDENCRSNDAGPETCDCGLDEGFKLCQPTK